MIRSAGAEGTKRRRGSRATVPPAIACVVVLVVGSMLAACGGSPGSGGSGRSLTTGASPVSPTIVVTFPVLAAEVAELTGDAATVEVLMPRGIDPHDYRPSARDIDVLNRADLVVASGLGLEEGLTDALDQVGRRGVPVFFATDHITVRRFGADEPREALRGGNGEHTAGGEDPHFWVDPVSMADAMRALASEFDQKLGLDLSARSDDLQQRLAALDRQTSQTLSVIPAERRLLVTGHESLGYFAKRYDLRLVGALVSSPSSQAAPSAADLAALKHQIIEVGVPAIFNEIGTPKALSATIAEETGVEVIELATHTLPDDGSYETFIAEIASGIRRGLEPR